MLGEAIQVTNLPAVLLRSFLPQRRATCSEKQLYAQISAHGIISFANFLLKTPATKALFNSWLSILVYSLHPKFFAKG